jgi:hypothetical protein
MEHGRPTLKGFYFWLNLLPRHDVVAIRSKLSIVTTSVIHFIFFIHITIWDRLKFLHDTNLILIPFSLEPPTTLLDFFQFLIFNQI